MLPNSCSNPTAGIQFSKNGRFVVIFSTVNTKSFNSCNGLIPLLNGQKFRSTNSETQEERIRNNQQKSQRSEDEKLELLQWEDSWENLGSWLDAHSVRDLIPFLIQNVTDEERADLLEECKTIPLWVEGQEIKKEVDSTVVMNEDAWVQFLDGFGAANVMGALTLSLSNRRFNEFVSLLSSSRAEEDE